MRILSSSLAFALLTTFCSAQISFGGRPLGHSHPQLLPVAPKVTMPQIDAAALIAEDEARMAAGKKGPYRFGFNHAVDLGLDNSGVWHEFSNGDRVWRLSIECPEAYSINFEFHEFVVPEGAKVFVHTDEEFLGAFDERSNPGETVLGVTQIAGDRITIEYFEPAELHGMGSLRIGQVTHAYRDILNKMRDLGDSGSCNNNVICPEGDPWRDQIRSVARITMGNSLCTGQLINNCGNDGTPYFLTANHCTEVGNPSTWVFRFNWESPICNQNLNGPTNQTISGSTLKTSSASTDVALLELNTAPPASYNVYYTGWDRAEVPPISSTAIHHPSGDIKKISFDVHPAVEGTFAGAACWRIIAWDDGTTEGGSSGSGLWNQDGLLVGQLFGGQANCFNNVNDYYGRFDISYNILDTWLGNCGTQLQGYPNTTSIDEQHYAELEIHPNPTTGPIMVQLPGGSTNAFDLKIHDASGRLVDSDRVNAAGQFTIDLSHLNEGIYLLELRNEDFRGIQRVIISK